MARTSSRPELLRRATRRAFRELATSIVLREIDGMWQDEGFAPAPANPDVMGERRSVFQSYLDAVDWTDLDHVARALRVFEQTTMGFKPQELQAAQDLLERDNYRLLPNGRITGGPSVELRQGSLEALSDPAAIHDGLDRITRALEVNDPAQAIGSAKELVESAAKLVLRERGMQINEKDDLPQLVHQAQVALGVHPSATQPGPDRSEAVKKILGGVVSITNGLAELRNRGYGTGHGPAGPRVGLDARHAHLAVAGARLWCEFMLDTLADPAAPWRVPPKRGARSCVQPG